MSPTDFVGVGGSSSSSSSSSVTDLISSVNSALCAAQSFLVRQEVLLLPSQSLTLESSLSYSALSLSKLCSSLQSTIDLSPLPLSTTTSSTDNCWFHRFLLSSDDGHGHGHGEDPRWLETFRMSQPTFSYLLSTLSPSLRSSLPSVPASYALAAALFRLAHAAPHSAVARRFGLTTPDACRAFYTVCKLICDRLGPTLFLDFRTNHHHPPPFDPLPNCCGILGVHRFPTQGPVLGDHGYLTVQALVDSKGRFLDVSAGWPSTITAPSILNQTKLFQIFQQQSTTTNNNNRYVLGPSCYPLMPWLLTPYRPVPTPTPSGTTTLQPSLTSSQILFNDVHSRSMASLRIAFRRLRANWQLLNRRWKEDCLEFFPFVIVAACLLINFSIENGQELPYGTDDDVGDKEFCAEDNKEIDEDQVYYNHLLDDRARQVRDVIAQHLSHLRPTRC